MSENLGDRTDTESSHFWFRFVTPLKVDALIIQQQINKQKKGA